MADDRQTTTFSRFFKTKKGEYGWGDHFLGIKVPISRMIASKYKQLPLWQIQKLLNNRIHEIRFCALCILVWQYRHDDFKHRQKIVNFYLKNLDRINNWDLVDTSAWQIYGDWLLDHNRENLLVLAKSDNLWYRRVAMLSTFAFVKRGESQWTFKLACLMLSDSQDLIHKATGWMLREVGKNCGKAELTSFLDKNYKRMPRMMLYYAIEKLDPVNRKHYLG